MAGAIQTTLMVGPLAAYLVLQGAWHAARRPLVIAGQHDFSLLALGLASLVGFGPVGRLLVALVPPAAELPARLTLLAALWLAVLVAAPATYRRLLIYGADPEELECAVGEALHDEVPGDFARTLHGFEDLRARRGLRIQATSRGSSSELETYGEAAEALATALADGLRRRLRDRPRVGRRGAAWVWFALAFLLLLLPNLDDVAADTPTGQALRGLLKHLVGPP